MWCGCTGACTWLVRRVVRACTCDFPLLAGFPCIFMNSLGHGVKGNQSWCEIDLERCVGCEVCVHIPQKKSNPYELLVCPWDAIEMVPTEQVAQVVAQVGGPPEYIHENWDRLVGTAQHLAELKAAAS